MSDNLKRCTYQSPQVASNDMRLDLLFGSSLDLDLPVFYGTFRGPKAEAYTGGQRDHAPHTPKRVGQHVFWPPKRRMALFRQVWPFGSDWLKEPSLAKLAHDNTLLGPFLFQRYLFHSEKARFLSRRTVFGLESSL